MATFGQYLIQHGVVSAAQLEEATHVMVVFGGRLGTVLVEAGVLTLEQVERHLSAHLDLPAVPPERIERPSPEALDALPVELVRRHGAFPMWIEKRTLHVAMREPQDPYRVDELAFATSLAIAPYVIAERRLVRLLERHHGIRPDSRFTDYHLLELAGHVRSATTQPEAEPAPRIRVAPPDEETSRHREALGIGPLGEGEELSSGEEREGAAARNAAPPGPTPASSPAEVAELESELVLLAPRERVVSLALRIASFYARAAAFFAVRQGMIQGLESAAELSGDRAAGIYLPLEAPSLLSAPVRSGRTFRGRPASSGIDVELMRALGRRPREVAVVPIQLGERVASLLYVDNGADALASSCLVALEAVGETVAAAYQRLLLASRALL